MSSKQARLEAFVEQMGKVPDDTIAEQAGVSRGVVGAYRRSLGIPAYTGYLFQKGHEPLTGRKAKGSSAKKTKKSKGSAKASPKADKPRKTGRRGRIDAFAHLVGVETDGQVAAKAGVSRSAVAAWRKRHGIEAAVPRGYHRPEEAPARATTPAPREPTVLRTGTAQAYELRATSKGEQHRFFVVGATLADACTRAESWVSGRRDGPWQIDEIRLLGDAVP